MIIFLLFSTIFAQNFTLDPLQQGNFKIIPITDSQPFTFGYPAQILIENRDYFDLLQNRANNLKVLYYGQNQGSFMSNEPIKRFLICSLDTLPKTYLGIEFLIKAWPSYSIIIQKSIKTFNLNLIMGQFNIFSLDPQFSTFYQNVHDVLINDPDFNSFLQQYYQNQKQVKNQPQEIVNLVSGEVVTAQDKIFQIDPFEVSVLTQEEQQLLNDFLKSQNLPTDQKIDTKNLTKLLQLQIQQQIEEEEEEEIQEEQEEVEEIKTVTVDPKLSPFDNIFNNPQNLEIVKEQVDQIIFTAPSHEARGNQINDLLSTYDIDHKKFTPEQKFKIQKEFNLRRPLPKNSLRQQPQQQRQQNIPQAIQQPQIQKDLNPVSNKIESPQINSLAESLKLKAELEGRNQLNLNLNNNGIFLNWNFKWNDKILQDFKKKILFVEEDWNFNKYFLNYSKIFKKHYSSPEEKYYRKTILKNSIKTITTQNSIRHEQKFGLTQYSDYSDGEFSTFFMMKSESYSYTERNLEFPNFSFNSFNNFFSEQNTIDSKRQKINKQYYNLKDYPQQLDWTKKGIVTTIQNQDLCSGCYAFSSLAALESQIQIKQKNFFNFSEQEIIDCSIGYQNNGCIGGLPKNVFLYIKEKGIFQEKDYPYLGDQKKCQKITKKKQYYKNLEFIILDNHVLALIAALQYGPVAVGHNVTINYKNYKQGILDENDCIINNKIPNHSSLLIGYNIGVGKPYFILKNSWGKNWGKDGYFYLKIGELKTSNQGICLIAKHRINAIPILEEQQTFSWNNFWQLIILNLFKKNKLILQCIKKLNQIEKLKNLQKDLTTNQIYYLIHISKKSIRNINRLVIHLLKLLKKLYQELLIQNHKKKNFLKKNQFQIRKFYKLKIQEKNQQIFYLKKSLLKNQKILKHIIMIRLEKSIKTYHQEQEKLIKFRKNKNIQLNKEKN